MTDKDEGELADLLAGIRQRQAAREASPYCPGSGHVWDYGAEPTCQRCHRTPAQLGVPMPVKHKASKPGPHTVWNGRVPSHDKLLDQMTDAAQEALRERLAREARQEELAQRLRDLDAERKAIEQELTDLRTRSLRDHR